MSKTPEDTSTGMVYCRNPNHSVDKHKEEPSCAYPSDMQEGKSGVATSSMAERYRMALEVIAEEADKLAAKHDPSQPDHIADLHSLAEFARKKAADL